MSYQRHLSLASLGSVISFKEADFWDILNNISAHNDLLVQGILSNVIDRNQQELRDADSQWDLHKFLRAMLEQAPSDDGRRYIAVALTIAHRLEKDGSDPEAVIKMAKAWKEYLFRPMQNLARNYEHFPSDSQTPTLDVTASEILPATRADQKTLVAARENNRCALTGFISGSYVAELEEQGKQVPRGIRAQMEAAHIIPYALNDFEDSTPSLGRAASTWDMLQMWTSYDIAKLRGENINNPANAIFMTGLDHQQFGRFAFCLEKVPDNANKYTVKFMRQDRTLSNDASTAEVEFKPSIDPVVEVPDPELLEIHAAFARVLHLCGASEYVLELEGRAKRDVAPVRSGAVTTDADRLAAKLELMVY